MVQWDAHQGPYIAILNAMALLGLWQGVRALTSSRSNESNWKSRARMFFASFTTTLGKSALAFAVLLLLIYLAVAPSTLLKIDRQYRERMAVVLDPGMSWRRTHEKMKEIEADLQWLE